MFRCLNVFTSADFVITESVDHNCIVEIGAKTRKPGSKGLARTQNMFLPSAYSVSALAPALEALCGGGEKLSAVLASTVLEEYVHVKPTTAFTNKVRRLARGRNETEALQVSHLRNYCQLLEVNGHFAGVETATGVEMKEVSLVSKLCLLL